MSALIITCNSGSSNVKLAAFDAASLNVVAQSQTAHEEAAAWLEQQGSGNIVAFGYRVVHGGRTYTAPERITDEVLRVLESFTPLAPLHQPHALKLINNLRGRYPKVPHVACFDTAFHRTIPDLEHRLPLPEHFYDEGVIRYGFHGLSYQYIASALPGVAGAKAKGPVAVMHLGNGCSICGMVNRESRAVSMGFSTLEGPMMGTRCGSLDPGVVLHLLEKGQSLAEVTELLYKNSGLKGVSGVSNDMRTLLADARPQSRLAVDLFCHLAAKQLGAIAMATGGLGVLVFTGGIGEHAAPVREGICRYLQWLGVAVDTQANEEHGPKISTPESTVDVYVIPTNEERVIAEETQKRMT